MTDLKSCISYKTVTSTSYADSIYNSGNGYHVTIYGNRARRYGSVNLKNVKGKSININGLATSYDLATSADLASDWITADDTNFASDGANLNSIIDGGSSDYSVGKFASANNLTSFTQKNNFVTFSGKK